MTVNVYISGAHSAPGGEVYATGLRTRDKVLKHPCGCAHSDTRWVQFCEAARNEYVEYRAQLAAARKSPEPGQDCPAHPVNPAGCGDCAEHCCADCECACHGDLLA